MTNKEKENPYFDAGLQKQLSKLIAQECLLSRMYQNAVLGAEPESYNAVADMFTAMSDTALRENAVELAGWCRKYGYNVPCGEGELKRAAGPKLAKYVDIKGGQTAGYYIDAAMKAEAESLSEYQAVLDDGKVAQFTDLQSAVWQIFFAKKEHIQSMASAKIAFMANADMIIQ